MSGYLQRMVLSVQKPAEAIRPILGSVFAPPPTVGGWETQTMETVVPGTFPRDETTFATRDRQRPALIEEHSLKVPSPVLHPSPDQEPSTKPQPPQPGRSRTAPEPELTGRSTPAVKSRFEPLFPGTDEVEKKSKREVSGPTANPGEQPPAAGRGRRETNGRSSTRSAVPAEPTEAFSGIPAGGEIKKPARVEVRPFAYERGDRTRTSMRPPATERREPDEIQIHIGRIEVSAAAPAQARPSVPKNAQGVPSLADYLRQRDGKIV